MYMSPKNFSLHLSAVGQTLYELHFVISFQPDLYRLMQASDQCFPVGTIFNYLFSPTRKRNRIEFIDDFPNEAEVISSLQIHPGGTSLVSRNINGGEDEEVSEITK